MREPKTPRKLRPYEPWEDALIRKMRTAGETRAAISKATGRSLSSIEARINRTCAVPHKDAVVRRTSPMVQRPLWDHGEGVDGDRDARHVAACLAQGGFERRELVAGKVVRIWP